MDKFPKSIIVVSDSTSLGGAELALIEILKQLVEWGIDTYLITRNEGELFDEFKKYTKNQLVLPFPYPSKAVSWIHYFSFKRDTSRFINGISGDKIIIVGDLYPLWATLELKSKTPVYSIYQGEYVFENDSCLHKWIRYGANRANKLIASAPICAHANPLKIVNKEIQCLNPKVDLTRFHTDLYDRNTIRSQLGFTPLDRLAICVGQVGFPKGQPWLAEQFLNNEILYKNWHLLIAGPIRDVQVQIHFEQLKSIDSENRLQLLGLRKDIPELYSASNLAIFPGTINESFGLAVVEAAIMDLPLLALRSGSIPYNLGEFYTGLFAKNNKKMLINAWSKFDPHMSDQLKKQINTDSLRAKLSQEAWSLNLKKLLSEKAAKQTIANPIAQI